jgi:hypothetical protein
MRGLTVVINWGRLPLLALEELVSLWCVDWPVAVSKQVAPDFIFIFRSLIPQAGRGLVIISEPFLSFVLQVSGLCPYFGIEVVVGGPALPSCTVIVLRHPVHIRLGVLGNPTVLVPRV